VWVDEVWGIGSCVDVAQMFHATLVPFVFSLCNFGFFSLVMCAISIPFAAPFPPGNQESAYSFLFVGRGFQNLEGQSGRK
jgi:hypothetical protein